MAEVAVRDASKQFPGPVMAVQRLSFTVGSGRICVVVGPSGSGKTTLLRLIAGLERLTTGQVWIDGKDVSQWQPWQRSVAMTFQRPALYPHLSVQRNLVFGLLGPREVAAERRRRLVEWLKIGRLLQRLPCELSGGELQRVALGKALIRRPAVFLLDEPLANLDTPLQNRILQRLGPWLRDQTSSTVYVTHNQREALALADNVVVLDQGTIQQIGSAEEIYQTPNNVFVATFFGNRPINLVRGRLTRIDQSWALTGDCGHLPIPASAVPFHGEHDPRNWILGVRPEHLRPAAAAPPNGWHCRIRQCRFLGCQWLSQCAVAEHGGPPSLELEMTGSEPQTLGPSWLRIDWSRAMWFDAATGTRQRVR